MVKQEVVALIAFAHYPLVMKNQTIFFGKSMEPIGAETAVSGELAANVEQQMQPSAVAKDAVNDKQERHRKRSTALNRLSALDQELRLT